MKSYYLLGAMALCLAASCTDSNEEVVTTKDEAQVKKEYAKNFAAKFGDIRPDQNWDLSTEGRKFASQSRAEKKVVTTTTDDQKTFSKNFLNAVKNVLPETERHDHLGAPYTLISQGPFTIYPLWHGQCMQWSLYVNDHLVGTYEEVMKMMGNKTTAFGVANTNEFSTTGWRIDLPVGTPVFINLVITKSNTGSAWEGQYAKNGDIITSFYNPPVPTRYWEGFKQVKLSYGSLVLKDGMIDANLLKDASEKNGKFLDHIIMFEDSKTGFGDADFNDLIIGIKGRNIAPDPIEIKEKESSYTYSVPSSVTKRYMVEDLGSIDDFDFNDIVFDINERKVVNHKVVIKTQEKTQGGEIIDIKETITDTPTDSTITQELTLRHLGGTLPFSVQVGNENVISNHEGVLDQDFSTVYPLKSASWDYVNHNIKVYIYNPQIGGSKPVEVDFPKRGDKAPTIIAVDPTKMWSPERVSITKEWWDKPNVLE